MLTEKYDLVVLDEILYCCDYNCLSGREIADFIRHSKPKWMHLVLTGRGAPPELVSIADTLTEMHKLKHAYEQGIQAEQGIEF
jgi:cob(I)alamin adenosyltransferase